MALNRHTVTTKSKMMKVPTHLSHYPVVGVDNYDQRDGIHADNTDAYAISVGVAQYDKSRKWEERDISAKVFRYVGGQWSRQSEELPLHRTFDLSTLTLKSILMCADKEIPQRGEKHEIDAEVIDERYKERVVSFYTTHREKLLPKIKELQEVLNHFMKLEKEIK